MASIAVVPSNDEFAPRCRSLGQG